MLITYKLFSGYPKFLTGQTFPFAPINSIINRVIHLSTPFITKITKYFINKYLKAAANFVHMLRKEFIHR